MRFYVFSLLLSLGLSAELAPQGMQKEDKHGLMWSNFFAIGEWGKKKEKPPEKKLKIMSWKSDAKRYYLLSHVQKNSVITVLSTAVLQTWGIIRRVIFH